VEDPLKPDAPPEARGSRLRTWLTITAVVVVVLGAVAGGGWLIVRSKYAFRPEEGWIDDQRLKMPPYEKPVVAVNGFDTYMAAADEKERIDATASSYTSASRSMAGTSTPGLVVSDYLSGDATLEQVQTYLAEIAPVLEELHRASDQTYVSPVDPTDPMPFFRHGATLREFARVVAAGAVAAHGVGDDELSLQRTRDGLALGINIPQHGPLIDMLVGIACMAIAQEQGLRTLTESDLSADAYVAHADYMRTLRARVYPYGGAVTFGFHETRHSLSMFADASPSDMAEVAGGALGGDWDELERHEKLQCWVFSRTWDPDMALEWIEDRHARILAEADTPFGQTDMDAMAARTEADLEARNDVLGQWLSGATTALAYTKWFLQHAMLLGQETAASLAAFRAMHGSYPATLEELVPEIMPELPPDPFTGDPLEYRRKGDGYVLYSVGPDRKDHGGSRMRSDTPGYHEEDIVFIPPKPRPTPAPSSPPGMGMMMGPTPGSMRGMGTE